MWTRHPLEALSTTPSSSRLNSATKAGSVPDTWMRDKHDNARPVQSDPWMRADGGGSEQTTEL